jgi:hypothetical protein
MRPQAPAALANRLSSALLGAVAAGIALAVAASCGSSSSGAVPDGGPGGSEGGVPDSSTSGDDMEAAAPPGDGATAGDTSRPGADAGVCDHTLANAACWQAFDIGRATQLESGFIGGAFDGRYVYYANTEQGGQVRYDTTLGFGAGGSIDVYMQPANLTGGYQRPGFDGHALYFPRLYGGGVARLDPAATFRSSLSWTTFDSATVTQPADAGQFASAMAGSVFDGTYMYFVPASSAAPSALRYDTRADFSTAGSWSAFDTSHVGPFASAFKGGTFDGRYVYFAPSSTNSPDAGPFGASGLVTRYDTQGTFGDAAAWSAFDATTVNPSAGDFAGVVFDGRYLYFVPSYSNGGFDCVVARYDTTAPFSDATSWAAFDATSLDPNGTFDEWGYAGGTFDGRYVYLVPASSGIPLLRYDTQAPAFGAATSWETFELSGASLDAANYDGAVFDGRFVYLMPDGYDPALRFEARSTAALPPHSGGSFY